MTHLKAEAKAKRCSTACWHRELLWYELTVLQHWGTLRRTEDSLWTDAKLCAFWRRALPYR